MSGKVDAIVKEYNDAMDQVWPVFEKLLDLTDDELIEAWTKLCESMGSTIEVERYNKILERFSKIEKDDLYMAAEEFNKQVEKIDTVVEDVFT